VDPRRCVAVEDSATGAAAARAAGAIVVAAAPRTAVPDPLAHTRWPEGVTGRTAGSVIAAFTASADPRRTAPQRS
jgi:beta-phosphoglucomutase-like phosphatase (HAD superfamily)